MRTSEGRNGLKSSKLKVYLIEYNLETQLEYYLNTSGCCILLDLGDIPTSLLYPFIKIYVTVLYVTLLSFTLTTC